MNKQIELARQVIESTDTHLFLTGKAGTGKTTFLRRLCREQIKRMVVLAPTGIAAINAGGVTIHSFFQLPFTPFVPDNRVQPGRNFKMSKQKQKIIRSIDLLVIDEISMVRADLLDAVDDALRRYRRNDKPFGGVQLLLIGDLQQLAPVAKEEEWSLLRPYYDTPYFFSSRALRRTDYATIELEKVYRQSDDHFLSLLNSIREGKSDKRVLDELNHRYIAGFVPRKDEGYIQLVTHNYQADRINTAELEKLSGTAYIYSAKIEGNFPEYAFPTVSDLELKVGAQVMFVKNDPNKTFFNGMIGEVVSLDDDNIRVAPKSDPDKLINVPMERWENIRYAIDEETKEIKEIVEGAFLQYPLKTAWAITIHKSQGLTFEKVMIDASGAFAHGQTYVALSRCKTLEGVVLTSPIPPRAIIADPYIDHFNQEMHSRNVDDDKLVQMRQTYGIHLLTELFTFERERISLAQILRLMEETQSHIYPQTIEMLRKGLQKWDGEVVNVSSRFHTQYQQMLREKEGDVGDEQIQERICKGSAYFVEKLVQLRELEAATRVDIDNNVVAERMDNVRQELQQTLQLHLRLLERVSEQGFETAEYLKHRAQLLLEDEEDGTKTAARRGKSKKGGEELEKWSVPTEVKNTALYYKLQKWRKQKAAELNRPTSNVLQAKALMAIANYMPDDRKSLQRVPHFGVQSLEKFGGEILEIVQEYKNRCEYYDQESRNAASAMSRPKESTQEVSLRMYREGLTVAEIAQKRELHASTILTHLVKYVDTGEVDFFSLVPDEHFQRVKSYLQSHPRTSDFRLTDIRNALGEDISFSDIRLTIDRLKW